MTVSVRDLIDLRGLNLSLAAGKKGIDRSLRWVHVSELEDPTPWLKGGEVLLTTGMGVGNSPARQRAYVRRLAEAGITGLGFAVGFSHRKVPKAMTDAANELDFPLIEIPYDVPFIAITEAVATRLLAEQYNQLQRAVEAQQVLTRAIMESEGVKGIAEALATVIKGWALVLDLHGMPLATTSRDAGKRYERIWKELKESRPEGTGFSLTVVDEGHHVWIQPIGAQGRVEAFLAVGKPDVLAPFDRIVAGHALSLFAIELSKERAVADAERRLQGDFFESLIRGSLTDPEINKNLGRFGFSRDGQVFVLAMEGGGDGDLEWACEDYFSRHGGGFLISPNGDGMNVMAAAEEGLEPSQISEDLTRRMAGPVRVGFSSEVPVSEAGRGLREARYALQVCRLEQWGSAGFGDLGTYRLLLSMAEPDALRAFADSLLAPLDTYDRDHGGELIPSLRSFLEHNARWETAAAELFVHRHTLRYRMRKVEELTGRKLSSSFDRMEFWLALRARELQSVQAEV
jgi:PucR family transcriptional regulator, purine catabolism regulatory protein